MNMPKAGIICKFHGKVDLLETEFWDQYENGGRWFCPICHHDADFDRARFEELEQA